MILKIICLNENVEEVFNITCGITSYIYNTLHLIHFDEAI